MSVKRQILHIDDGQEFTQLMAEYLKDFDYETTSSNDPRKFIAWLPIIQEPSTRYRLLKAFALERSLAVACQVV